jgi:glucose-1-phosphate thymidylyltransferase
VSTAAPRDEAAELVGVLPAAGRARRSGPLPCSKEIFPVGVHAPAGRPGLAGPEPACGYLLEAMRVAGARRAVVGLRAGKWDISAHLADGAAYDLALAYTVLADSPGVPWTVRHALSAAGGARVLFGFPDIVFRPADALARVERRQREWGADLALGLFPARRPEKMDMVATDSDGRVRELVIKSRRTDLRHTWILAVWTPAFSAFLDARLRALDAGGGPAHGEVQLGDVIRAAVDDGWRVDAVEVSEGAYCDIGTPEELAEAQAEFG